MIKGLLSSMNKYFQMSVLIISRKSPRRLWTKKRRKRKLFSLLLRRLHPMHVYIYMCVCVCVGLCVSLHTHTYTYISSSVIYCLKGNSLIRGHPDVRENRNRGVGKTVVCKRTINEYWFSTRMTYLSTNRTMHWNIFFSLLINSQCTVCFFLSLSLVSFLFLHLICIDSLRKIEFAHEREKSNWTKLPANQIK